MRKVAGNDVITLPVVADIYLSRDAEITYPRTFSIANFIDLNQDGTMEVIVSYHRWEEDGAMIYTIHDQEIALVP
jgi:hypothetical protein